MVARAEDARTAVLQTDFHLPLKHKQPLRRIGAMELAAEPHRTLAQLQSARGQHRRQAGCGRAFGEVYRFLAESRAAIGVGEQHDLVEGDHERLLKKVPGCTRRHNARDPVKDTGRWRRQPHELAMGFAKAISWP
ncbi:hypothetical protein D9M69_596770 [compost metagenome]